MSLSSVVSNLVRASMGTSISGTVTDEDLDKHIAELILKEAKQKAQRYSTEGVSAYLRRQPVDTNVPRTNKRFLSSIIKSTDDHNKNVLRAQALAAQEIKKEIAAVEKRERMARAEEAVAARKLMERGGKRVLLKEEAWDRWDGRHESRKRRKRSEGGGHDESHRTKRRRRSKSREISKRESRHRRRDRSTSPSASERRRSRKHRSRSRSAPPPPEPPTPIEDEEEVGPQPLSSFSPSQPPPPKSPPPPLPAGPSRRRSLTPPPPRPDLPSKMDKYFTESYDPRLDVAPLSATPSVPTTGLIDGSEFDGWDAMLDLIRARREDKVEKKRLERLGITTKKGSLETSGMGERWSEGVNIMDIQYKKKGAVREWDLGKEGF